MNSCKVSNCFDLTDSDVVYKTSADLSGTFDLHNSDASRAVWAIFQPEENRKFLLQHSYRQLALIRCAHLITALECQISVILLIKYHKLGCLNMLVVFIHNISHSW